MASECLSGGGDGRWPQSSACGPHGSCKLNPTFVNTTQAAEVIAAMQSLGGPVPPVYMCVCDSGWSSSGDFLSSPYAYCHINQHVIFALWWFGFVLDVMIWKLFLRAVVTYRRIRRVNQASNERRIADDESLLKSKVNTTQAPRSIFVDTKMTAKSAWKYIKATAVTLATNPTQRTLLMTAVHLFSFSGLILIKLITVGRNLDGRHPEHADSIGIDAASTVFYILTCLTYLIAGHCSSGIWLVSALAFYTRADAVKLRTAFRRDLTVVILFECVTYALVGAFAIVYLTTSTRSEYSPSQYTALEVLLLVHFVCKGFGPRAILQPDKRVSTIVMSNMSKHHERTAQLVAKKAEQLTANHAAGGAATVGGAGARGHHRHRTPSTDFSLMQINKRASATATRGGGGGGGGGGGAMSTDFSQVGELVKSTARTKEVYLVTSPSHAAGLAISAPQQHTRGGGDLVALSPSTYHAALSPSSANSGDHTRSFPEYGEGGVLLAHHPSSSSSPPPELLAHETSVAGPPARFRSASPPIGGAAGDPAGEHGRMRSGSPIGGGDGGDDGEHGVDPVRVRSTSPGPPAADDLEESAASPNPTTAAQMAMEDLDDMEDPPAAAAGKRRRDASNRRSVGSIEYNINHNHSHHHPATNTHPNHRHRSSSPHDDGDLQALVDFDSHPDVPTGRQLHEPTMTTTTLGDRRRTLPSHRHAGLVSSTLQATKAGASFTATASGSLSPANARIIRPAAVSVVGRGARLAPPTTGASSNGHHATGAKSSSPAAGAAATKVTSQEANQAEQQEQLATFIVRLGKHTRQATILAYLYIVLNCLFAFVPFLRPQVAYLIPVQLTFAVMTIKNLMITLIPQGNKPGDPQREVAEKKESTKKESTRIRESSIQLNPTRKMATGGQTTQTIAPPAPAHERELIQPPSRTGTASLPLPLPPLQLHGRPEHAAGDDADSDPTANQPPMTITLHLPVTVPSELTPEEEINHFSHDDLPLTPSPPPERRGVHPAVPPLKVTSAW